MALELAGWGEGGAGEFASLAAACLPCALVAWADDCLRRVEAAAGRDDAEPDSFLAVSPAPLEPTCASVAGAEAPAELVSL